MKLHKVGDKAVVLEGSGVFLPGDEVYVIRVDSDDRKITYSVSKDSSDEGGWWVENSKLEFDITEDQLSLDLEPESKYQAGDVVFVIGDGEFWGHDQEATITSISGQDNGVTYYYADFKGDLWAIDDDDIEHLGSREEKVDEPVEEKVEEPELSLHCMADKELYDFIKSTEEKVEGIESEIKVMEDAIKSLQEQIHLKQVNASQMKSLVGDLKNLLQSRID